MSGAGRMLSLLADASEVSPLLVLIDDAHWLDRASLDAWMFAARRLGPEAVGVLIATRDEPGAGDAPDGSFVSTMGGVTVRVIDARITVTLSGTSRHTGRYRLTTTLTDHRRYPALDLGPFTTGGGRSRSSSASRRWRSTRVQAYLPGRGRGRTRYRRGR